MIIKRVRVRNKHYNRSENQKQGKYIICFEEIYQSQNQLFKKVITNTKEIFQINATTITEYKDKYKKKNYLRKWIGTSNKIF